MMEPNQQNIPVEQVPHTPNQHSHLLPMLIVGVLMLLVGLSGGYLLFANKNVTKQQEAAQVSQTISPTITLAQTVDSTADWKTYTNLNSKYSIKYPPSWYVYEYNNDNFSINISDVSNPTEIPQTVSPQGHTLIGIGVYQGVLPSSFPYTNGSSSNSTIKQFSINSYTGIRGNQTSTLGLGEAVYLNNPKGGYLVLTKEIDDKQMFDKILSTLKFTQ